MKQNGIVKYYILMADIMSSGKSEDRRNLIRQFSDLVTENNREMKEFILSPYTITLGDEFQGIARSLDGALQTIFYLEEVILKMGYRFKLRYVLYYGLIDSEINYENAHGMLGPGLTSARRRLSEKRRNRPRFHLHVPGEKTTGKLNALFSVIDGLAGQWKPRDYRLIADMIDNPNNQQVGLKHRKNRSQIWKRRKNLLIQEYITLKNLIFQTAHEYTQPDSVSSRLSAG